MRKDPITGTNYCAYLPMKIVTLYAEGVPSHASIQPGIMDPEKQGCEVGWSAKKTKKTKEPDYIQPDYIHEGWA